MLSPALLDLNRDAFVIQDAVKTTVDPPRLLPIVRYASDAAHARAS
jgi:hypothetical protein